MCASCVFTRGVASQQRSLAAGRGVRSIILFGGAAGRGTWRHHICCLQAASAPWRILPSLRCCWCIWAALLLLCILRPWRLLISLHCSRCSRCLSPRRPSRALLRRRGAWPPLLLPLPLLLPIWPRLLVCFCHLMRRLLARLASPRLPLLPLPPPNSCLLPVLHHRPRRHRMLRKRGSQRRPCAPQPAEHAVKIALHGGQQSGGMGQFLQHFSQLIFGQGAAAAAGGQHRSRRLQLLQAAAAGWGREAAAWGLGGGSSPGLAMVCPPQSSRMQLRQERLQVSTYMRACTSAMDSCGSPWAAGEGPSGLPSSAMPEPGRVEGTRMGAINTKQQHLKQDCCCRCRCQPPPPPWMRLPAARRFRWPSRLHSQRLIAAHRSPLACGHRSSLARAARGFAADDRAPDVLLNAARCGWPSGWPRQRQADVHGAPALVGHF